MKAVVITAPGGPEVLELQERPTPEPRPGEIRVRVHASAMNRADIMQREGIYPPPAGAPADISGIEYAGAVDAVGSDASVWQIGSRVMGIVGGGGHAEFVCVGEREAIRVPAEFSWEEAAAIPEAFLTAYDGLFPQLDIQPRERVLIHAVASGVGTAGLQLARIGGASVIGTSRSASKLERAKELGLELGIHASRGDWPAHIEKATESKGVDAILDLVGAGYLAGNLRVLATRGRLLVVGMTSGARTEIDLATVVRKRLRIQGTVLRARSSDEKSKLAQEFSVRVIPLFESKRIKPVVDRVLSFADVRSAHEVMGSNETFGKIVLRWD